MPRWASKVDGNHAHIVNGLREIGASVESLARLGGGAPDLLVGYNGKNYLLELKDPSSSHSKGTSGNGKKTKDRQLRWYQSWRGRVDVVYSLEEAILLVTGRGITINEGGA